MYYYLYKVTNLINDKIYIGVHETSNLNDGYLGSGKLINRAIKKYGKSNFKKEILEFFENRELMYERETLIVNEEFLSKRISYNLVLGGLGGSISINRKPHTKPHTEKTKEILRQKSTGRIVSAETRKRISENNFSKKYPEKQREHARKAALASHKSRVRKNGWSHSDNTRNKISEALIGKQQIKSTCPHCFKTGGIRAMNRWHFNKCKLA
jgi:group I intron endonuclease